VNKYAIVLVLLGAALAALGPQFGRSWFILWWLAADFIAVGIAYGLRRPGVFGKRSDGTIPFWSWLCFLPYFALNLVVWQLARIASSEPASNAVCDTLIVGRRPLNSERLPEIENLVDLTSEFQEPSRFRAHAGYLCLPTLDATAPDLEQLALTMNRLKPGRTFIHCAQGHGRTGLAALAFLLARGLVDNVPDALRQIQSARPAIRLNDEQYRCAVAYAALLQRTA
jgi:protein-tyrosine phosphatase